MEDKQPGRDHKGAYRGDWAVEERVLISLFNSNMVPVSELI
jgi:hypothetical protein